MRGGVADATAGVDVSQAVDEGADNVGPTESGGDHQPGVAVGIHAVDAGDGD